jgi:MFS transporter, OCT family, solute carrier family 22 (organic cation transporter), member 4/5
MGYDDVIPHLGEFGKYQRKIYFLLCLPAITCAFHKLVNVFLQAKPDHRCQLPFEAANATYVLPDSIRNLSYPIDELTKTWSTCEYLKANFTDDFFQNGTTSNLASVSCNSWIYDHSTFESSTVTEWDLVCDKAWLRATADSLFMIGVMVGSLFFGWMSDEYGRKKTFFASLVIQVVFGMLAGIAPEYITFSIARMIVGATTSGVFLVLYVIAMEMVGPNYRLFAGVVIQMFFSVGYVLTAAFAYFFTSWRDLQIYLTLFGVLFFTYWWLIPESTRWLISQNRIDEAKNLIGKAAKYNKVTVPADVLENLVDKPTEVQAMENTHKPSVIDLFRYPNLRRKTMLIFFNWFVISGTYYGLSWNTNNLGGNALLNFVISGAIELPAYIFLLLTLNKWGRKSILAGSMILAGAVLLTTMVIPQNYDWLVITLTMLGKMAITASYGTIYIFSTEQFPTVIRNVGLGAASTSARIGGILAPYCLLLADIWRPLPLMAFGALAFAGGLLSLMLPETHKKKLPDTIAEGEIFGKKIDVDVENITNEEMKVLSKSK